MQELYPSVFLWYLAKHHLSSYNHEQEWKNPFAPIRMSQLHSPVVLLSIAPLSFSEAAKVLQRSPVQVADASSSYQIHSLLAPLGQFCGVFHGVCLSSISR